MKKYLIILFIGLLCANYLISEDLNSLEQIKEMNNNILRTKQIKDYLINGHSKIIYTMDYL